MKRLSPRSSLQSAFSLHHALLLLLIATVISLVFNLSLPLDSVLLAATPSTPTAPFATTITVDTSEDLESGSLTKTCTYNQGALFVAAGDGCTLRRALLEASARPQADRPIAIQFNLANNDPNANLEVIGTWTLPVDNALPKLKTDTILDINGQVTIDGSTQPGGRTDGPKIIIATNDFSLEVESEGNIIRNLAFKGGGVIFLKENNNTVTDIWMGLSDDGESIVFRTPAQPQRLAGGGIQVASDNNVVQDNTIAGAFTSGINVDGGSNNLIQNNQIGTRADGTVPTVPASAQCLRSFSLDPQNWYGGWGIALTGSNNQILNNRIAGLHILQSANDTPPMAIEIFGTGHEVRENIIGRDSAGSDVGVCGQGIKVSGSNTQIIDNLIIKSRAGFEDDEETAILASDSSPTFGQITVRGNLVEDGPGNVYRFGPGISAVLRTFNPAKITNINGINLTGTAGDASPCPNCLIDIYRDDSDAIGETLAHLGSTTADADGNFSFILDDPLPPTMGIRTSSTTQAAGIIGSFGAGTTSKVSKLFLPLGAVTVTGPITGDIDNSYAFTITVTPPSTTTPLSYTVTATDADPLTLNNSNSTVVVATYKWNQPGMKEIKVTVNNDLGTVTSSHPITITGTIPDPENPDPENPESGLYLPLIER